MLLPPLTSRIAGTTTVEGSLPASPPSRRVRGPDYLWVYSLTYRLFISLLLPLWERLETAHDLLKYGVRISILLAFVLAALAATVEGLAYLCLGSVTWTFAAIFSSRADRANNAYFAAARASFTVLGICRQAFTFNVETRRICPPEDTPFPIQPTPPLALERNRPVIEHETREPAEETSGDNLARIIEAGESSLVACETLAERIEERSAENLLLDFMQIVEDKEHINRLELVVRQIVLGVQFRPTLVEDTSVQDIEPAMQRFFEEIQEQKWRMTACYNRARNAVIARRTSAIRLLEAVRVHLPDWLLREEDDLRRIGIDLEQIRRALLFLQRADLVATVPAPLAGRVEASIRFFEDRNRRRVALGQGPPRHLRMLEEPARAPSGNTPEQLRRLRTCAIGVLQAIIPMLDEWVGRTPDDLLRLFGIDLDHIVHIINFLRDTEQIGAPIAPEGLCDTLRNFFRQRQHVAREWEQEAPAEGQEITLAAVEEESVRSVSSARDIWPNQQESIRLRLHVLRIRIALYRLQIAETEQNREIFLQFDPRLSTYPERDLAWLERHQIRLVLELQALERLQQQAQLDQQAQQRNLEEEIARELQNLARFS